MPGLRVASLKESARGVPNLRKFWKSTGRRPEPRIDVHESPVGATGRCADAREPRIDAREARTGATER